MRLVIMSFGYKYGIPSDADLVFDVRFLPNPFYVKELRDKNGNYKEIQDYVCKTGEADEFLEKTAQLLDFLIPRYAANGKKQLTVCMGCTGGKHRSVTIANRLGDHYHAGGIWQASVLHRDITKQ